MSPLDSVRASAAGPTDEESREAEILSSFSVLK